MAKKPSQIKNAPKGQEKAAHKLAKENARLKRELAETKAKLKEYRHLYSEAKKKGLVKGNLDARKLQPSKYMKAKLNKLAPYINAKEEYTFLKVDKSMAKRWKENPNSFAPMVSNGVVIARQEPGIQNVVKKGFIRRIQKLEAGTHEYIPLPFKPRNWQEFKDEIEANPSYNELLRENEDELFNFKIFGQPSRDSYGNIEALIAHLEAYRNFEEWDESYPDWFEENFELFRSYKNWKWEQHTAEYQRAKWNAGRRAWWERQSPEKKAAYLKRRRENRTSQRSYARQKAVQRQQYAGMQQEEREAMLEKRKMAMRAKREAFKAQGLTARGREPKR